MSNECEPDRSLLSSDDAAGVIERGERYLARRFGVEYLAYRARVRRWF